MSQLLRVVDGTILPDIETLTGNSGGPVGPDALGNIDIRGDINGSVTVTGTPASNLLTISLINEQIFDTTTADATPTNLNTGGTTIPNNFARQFLLQVNGRRDDFSGAAFATLSFGVRKEGANPAVFVGDGASYLDFGKDAAVAATAAIDVTITGGNTLNIVVVGEAATNWTWEGIWRFI